MMKDQSINDLYFEAYSCTLILPKLLEEANNEKEGPIDEDLISKYYGLPEALLHYNISAEAEMNKLRSLIDIMRQRDKKLPIDSSDHVTMQKAEAELATKFCKCCDTFGKEKLKMLGQAADILLEMGILYMNYANNGDGIQQKLNFIRSAALITGAVIRYEKLKENDKANLASADLRRLHTAIYKIDCVQGSDNSDLVEFSNAMKSILQENRRQMAQKLSKIVHTINESDFEEERTKITRVREICEQSTECYLTLLRKIAVKCESIMGKTPCEYAIIGLGSLARNEATLYSDFEHAIILDDDIDSKQKEYFRWFSTIFQIIIIGLGETVIPSVNIRSLCDLYSDDKAAKWFVDEITPLGISFDGMMPHACKIPLGRPEETKMRKHTVELIQPVSTMANFLTREEEMKNGYFLSDVLSRTCFVYGSKRVYECFVLESNCILDKRNREDVGKQQLKNILLNPNEAMQSAATVHSLVNKSVKASNYRPVTALLSSIAVLNGIKAQSSFEIVDQMLKLKIIDDNTHHMLMSAIAVTMEIRMKAYVATGHQRRNLTHAEMAAIGGRERVLDCYITMAWLSIHSQAVAYDSWKGVENLSTLIFPSKYSDYWNGEKLRILQIFSMPEEYVKLGLEFTSDIIKRYKNDEVTPLRAKVLLKTTFKGLVLSFGHFCSTTQTDSKKWEWSCQILYQLAQGLDHKLLEVYHRSMSLLYFLQGQFKKSVEEFEKWHKLFLILPPKERTPTTLSIGIYFCLVSAMSQALNGDDMLERTERMYAAETDYATRCVLKVGTCRALLKKGLQNIAKEKLVILVTDVHKNARQLGRFSYNALLGSIGSVQMESGFPIDAINTGKLLKSVGDDDTTTSSVNTGVKNTDGPLGQKVEALRTYHDLGLQEIFCSFSYKELITGLAEMLNRYRAETTAGKQKLFIPYMGCLMVLMEKVRHSDIIFLVNEIQLSPKKVKASRALQPFLYACFANFVQGQRAISNIPDVAVKQNIRILKDITQGQHRIFKALFGYTAADAKLHELAIGRFTDFKFESCIRLLWKLLYWKKTDSFAKPRLVELIIVTSLTIIILQKRQSPRKYFAKIHEISMVQSQYLQMVSRGRDRRFLAENIVHCLLYRYFINDPHISIYNLAAVCLKFHRKKAMKLLWKMIHAHNMSAPIKYTSLAMFVHMAVVILGDQLNHDNFLITTQNVPGKK